MISLLITLCVASVMVLAVSLCVVAGRSERRLERQLREDDRCRNCGKLPDECPCEYFLALLN